MLTRARLRKNVAPREYSRSEQKTKNKKQAQGLWERAGQGRREVREKSINDLNWAPPRNK